MAKKKVFTINKSLTDALTDTVTAAQNYTGNLHIEVIPLRKICLDEDNPRELSLTKNDAKSGIDKHDPSYDNKCKELASLESIASSIKDQGLINPVLVYKDGDNYQLIAGERRTLASLLAGKEDIPAKILSAKPDALKISTLQWIENIEREDLSLWERMKNLLKLFSAYTSSNGGDIKNLTITQISQLTGASSSQAANYKHLLLAPPQLMDAIANGQVNSIEKAVLVVSSNPEKQEKLLSACINGASLKELKRLASQTTISKPRQTGRPATSVSLGKTRSVDAVRVIFESVAKTHSADLPEIKALDIDWNDYRAVSKAFSLLLKSIETLHA